MSSDSPEHIKKLDPDKEYVGLNAEGDLISLSHDPEPLTPQDIQLDNEHGSSGTDVISGAVIPYEYNPKWRFDVALDVCEQMRKSDASVRSVLQVIKLPLMRATWKIIPGQEDGGDDEDKKRAKKLHDVIVGGKGRYEGWRSTLTHHLTMLDFGFALSEIVFDVDSEGFYFPHRLAPRLARTVKEFKVWPDGSIKYVRQEAVKNGKVRSLRIPGQYVLLTVHDQEGDNYWGVPLLRYIYQHYYYKTEFYKIDAVRLDRWGIGIPIIEIAKGYVLRPNDKRLAETILKGLRSHHRAYVLLPEELKLKILSAETERSGASGLMEAVDHHDVMMARSVLAHFLTMGQQKHGNYGTSVAWADMFLYGLQALANQISEAFTLQMIRPVYDLNWDIGDREYPKMSAASLEDINGKELAAAMYNLVLGQVLTPDDDLEAHTRVLFGLPRIQKGFSRLERGAVGQVPQSPAEAAANVITGKPSDDDREAMPEPTPGTKPSTTPPPRGPVRAPGDLG